jgi:glutamine---fructose-6-phosphate transaminase (isomerizing)
LNINDGKFNKYEIVREMFQTADIVKNFDLEKAEKFSKNFMDAKKILFTGEGSSRIFPSKRAMSFALKNGTDIPFFTEGATQAMDYKLDDFSVLVSSNSGKTKEAARLLTKLGKENHGNMYSVIANGNTILEKLATEAYVLSCGKENTVAATKSVVEQALVFDVIMRSLLKKNMPDLRNLSERITETLSIPVDPEITERFKKSPTVYFAGRNDGVAEELVLKTSEITRKKAVYLEGTYAVHGIEEVMRNDEMVVIVDPFADEEEKFRECLERGVGMSVIAIASRKTSFPTIVFPHMEGFDEYLQLVAGWNLLVSAAVELGVNPDKPLRARKIGNEFV